MGDTTRVQYTGLNEAAGGVDGVARGLKEQLEELQGRVKAVGETWTGEAKTTFDYQMRRWDQAMEHLFGVETAIARTTTNSGVAYRATDGYIAQRMLM